ncbi:hypothetical protein JFL43_16840 [Viridibacillus sp. YIM B01967]|uniref:Uncharacterized protein n=1 Tax=Viridibacillus soli TaxID=2798301 RepID=A0ABS1HAM9_9BACL|nr:hypothetical protein [Viridibacillus soli]MBK3496494.1 hypothetical protein [Viridibacillus soli]
MMKYILGIILIAVPGIYGYLGNTLIIPLYPMIAQIFFVVYWLWIGYIIGRLSKNQLQGFLFGNSLWIISLLLFIWQFMLTDNVDRNVHIAAIPQYYILSFAWLASKLSSIFFSINGTTIIIVAYVCMLFIFILGFRAGKK